MLKENVNWYKNTYEKLIEKANNRTLPENTYFEVYHIIPRCLGGSNDSSNLVKLTAREHIIAHMLLANQYINNYSLWVAANLMCSIAASRGVVVSSRIAALARENHSRTYKTKLANHNIRLQMSNRGIEVNSTEEKKKILREKSLSLKDQIMPKVSKALKGRNEYNVRKRPILDADGKWYESISECARVKNIKIGTLWKWIKKGMNGYKYKDNTGKMKKIVGPDGTVYNSIRECSKKTGHTKASSISKWLKEFPEKGYKILND